MRGANDLSDTEKTDFIRQLQEILYRTVEGGWDAKRALDLETRYWVDDLMDDYGLRPWPSDTE